MCPPFSRIDFFFSDNSNNAYINVDYPIVLLDKELIFEVGGKK